MRYEDSLPLIGQQSRNGVHETGWARFSFSLLFNNFFRPGTNDVKIILEYLKSYLKITKSLSLFDKKMQCGYKRLKNYQVSELLGRVLPRKYYLKVLSEKKEEPFIFYMKKRGSVLTTANIIWKYYRKARANLAGSTSTGNVANRVLRARFNRDWITVSGGRYRKKSTRDNDYSRKPPTHLYRTHLYRTHLYRTSVHRRMWTT